MNRGLKIGLGLAALGGAAYLLYRQTRRAPGAISPGGAVNVATAPTVESVPTLPRVTQQAAQAAQNAINYDRVLKVGSKGNDVKLVQRAANDILRDVFNKPALSLQVDGVYGNKTANIIKTLSGSSDISYNQMKALKTKLYLSKGLNNPYGAGSLTYDGAGSILNYFTA